MSYFTLVPRFTLGLSVTVTLPVALCVRKTKSPNLPDILSIPGISVTLAIFFSFLY